MLPHYVSVLISTLSPGKAIRRRGIKCLKKNKFIPWNPKFPQIGAQNDEIERTESYGAHLMTPRGALPRGPDAGNAAVSRDDKLKESTAAEVLMDARVPRVFRTPYVAVATESLRRQPPARCLTRS